MSIRLQLKTKQLSDLAKEYGDKAKPNLRRIIPGETSRRRIDFGKELAEAIAKFSALQTTLVELSDLTEKMQEDCQQLHSKIVSIESAEAYIIDPITQKYQQKACKIFQEAEPELESALKGIRKAIRSVRYKAESDDPSNSPDIVRSHEATSETKAAQNPSSKPAKSKRGGRKEHRRSKSKDKYHAEHSRKKSSEPRERNRSTSVDKHKSRQHSDKKSKHSKSKKDKPTDQTTDNAAASDVRERNAVPPQVLNMQRQEAPRMGVSPLSPPPAYQMLPPPGSNVYLPPSLGLYPQIETSTKDGQIFLR